VSPGTRERRPQQGTAHDPRRPNLKSDSILRDVADNLTQVQLRVVLESVQTAAGWWWDRRADEIEAARPAPGEFHGRATRAELSRRWCDLTELAQACRARAEMARRGIDEGELADVYDQVLEEIA
jgi:hypothetical protein